MTRSILSKKFQTFHLLSPARSVRCLVCSTCSVACSKGSEKTLAPKVVSDSMGPLKPMRQLFCRVASLTSVVSLFHGALQPLRYRSSITIGSSDAAVRQLNDGQGSSATASRWSQRIGPRTEQKRAGSMQSFCLARTLEGDDVMRLRLASVSQADVFHRVVAQIRLRAESNRVGKSAAPRRLVVSGRCSSP